MSCDYNAQSVIDYVAGSYAYALTVCNVTKQSPYYLLAAHRQLIDQMIGRLEVTENNTYTRLAGHKYLNALYDKHMQAVSKTLKQIK